MSVGWWGVQGERKNPQAGSWLSAELDARLNPGP